MAFAPSSKLNNSSSATATSGQAPARLTSHQLLPRCVRFVRTRVGTGRSCRPPRFASFAANARRPCHNKHPPRRRCTTALDTMDTGSSPPRPARIVAGARRRSNRQLRRHGHENDACPVPLMAAAAAAFGSGPAPTHVHLPDLGGVRPLVKTQQFFECYCYKRPGSCQVDEPSTFA